MSTSSAEPFIHALRAGDRDAVAEVLREQPRRLHEFVTEPREWGEEMWLPLHHAAAAGAVEVVRFLLEQGASPDCRTRFTVPTHGRATPLHLAAAAGHTAVVDALLSAGAEPDVLDAATNAPLHLAARHGRPDAVNRLARGGAGLELRNGNGRTPLHDAIRATPGVNDIDANACAIFLIDANANVNATCPREPEGYTPMHRCVSAGEARAPVIRRLREAGADESLRDPRHDRTAVDLAAHLGRATLL